MSIQFTVIETADGLREIEEEWAELAIQGGQGALFRSASWLMPWWKAYHRVLGAELYVLAGYAKSSTETQSKLVCLAPFYRRTARAAAGIKVREIRLIGDAGPRPPALGVMCMPDYQERAGIGLATILMDKAGDWDVLDLAPLADPSRVRAFFVSRMNSNGFGVETSESGYTRRIALTVAGIDISTETLVDDDATADPKAISKGLGALRRLSRLEWASREEQSPLADAQAMHLLEEASTVLGALGRARVARLDNSAGEAIAAALVVDDAKRAVVMAMAIDPEVKTAAERLLQSEARAASERGCDALDVVGGAVEHSIANLPSSRQRAIRLRVFSNSSAATLSRTYGTVARRLQGAIGASNAAAASARAAWSKIRSAASHMAAFDRMHLYRGELWTRGVAMPPGVEIRELSQKDFESLPPGVREETIESLELDIEYCKEKWDRGDFVAFASINDRPAGIAWSAFGKVEVSQLGWSLSLESSEAYIHDVFVAAEARGRSVAPAMLEFMAGQLRQRDLYRSWALIGYDKVASVRAFEKASYAPVCDVIRTKVGSVEKLVVRPPDPEAKKLLGL